MRSLTIRLLTVYFVAVVALRTAPLPQQADQAQGSNLTNKEIAEMHGAGLSSDIILEKIRTSACSFDTSPAALVDLKKAGIAEPVILTMMAKSERRPAVVQGFQVVPVASDKVLNGGAKDHVQHIPYSDILARIQMDLTDAFTAKGAGKAVEVPEGNCCRVKIELLQALSLWTLGGTINMNLVLRVSTVGPDGTEFSKTIQGDAHRKKWAGSWRSWQEAYNQCLNEATASLVKTAADDPQLIKLLSTTGLS